MVSIRHGQNWEYVVNGSTWQMVHYIIRGTVLIPTEAILTIIGLYGVIRDMHRCLFPLVVWCSLELSMEIWFFAIYTINYFEFITWTWQITLGMVAYIVVSVAFGCYELYIITLHYTYLKNESTRRVNFRL